MVTPKRKWLRSDWNRRATQMAASRSGGATPVHSEMTTDARRWRHPSTNVVKREMGSIGQPKIRLSTAWAMLSNITGIVLLVATLILSASIERSSEPSLVAGYYLSATTALLIGAILSSRFGALYLMTSMYFCTFTALPAYVQVLSGRYPFGASYSEEQLNSGFFILAIGQLSLIIGVATRARRREMIDGKHRKMPVGRPAEPQRLSVVALWLGLGAVVLALVAGPQRVFLTRFDEGGSVILVDGLETQILFVARAFALVGLLLSLLALKSGASHGSARWTCVFTAVVALVVNFPPALPRFQLLGILLAISFLLFDFGRVSVKLIFTALSTFFLMYFFPAVKDLSGGLSADRVFGRDPAAYLTSVDFDSFKQIVDSVIYFSSAPLRTGENFLGVALFWVPRALWPSKPIHTGAIVSEGLGYPYNNVSSPLPAEAFASWGLTGVVVILFLTGMLIGTLEGSHRLRSVASFSWARTLTYVMAAGYAVILFRGALNAVAPMIMPAFLIVAIIYLFWPSGRNTPVSAPVESAASGNPKQLSVSRP